MCAQIGDVMSLMSNDTTRTLELTYCIHIFWTSPIMIAIGIWLLWQQVGVASLAGLATLVTIHDDLFIHWVVNPPSFCGD
jgi:hypothetical protein